MINEDNLIEISYEDAVKKIENQNSLVNHKIKDSFIITIKKSISLINCKFEKGLTIKTDNNDIEIKILKCEIYEDIKIGTRNGNPSCFIEGSNMSESKIYFFKEFKNIYFKNCEFDKITFSAIGDKMKLEQCNGNKINIEEKHKLNGLEIIGEFGEKKHIKSIELKGEINNIQTIGYKFNNFFINGKNKSTYLYNCEIKDLYISGNYNNSSLFFKEIKYEKIIFSKAILGKGTNFINFYRISLEEFGENRGYRKTETEKLNKNFKNYIILSISDTNFNESQFHDCDFGNGRVLINTSSLVDIITTNLKLPEKIESDNLREVYRQLKYNASKQGDSYQALIYHSKEMEALEDELGWKKNFWDKLILKLGKLTNNHGTSWTRPFFIFIIFNILSTTLFLFSALTFKFEFGLKPIEILSGIGQFLVTTIQFISITRFDVFENLLLKESELKISYGAQIIFYLAKIINAFLLYQLLVAFRKFNKKF